MPQDFQRDINDKRSRKFSKTLQYCAFALLFSTQVCAVSFDEGKQAFLDKDYEKALSILQPLAVQGNPEAQVTLGLMYEMGHGVDKNLDTALEWYQSAADQGLPNVQHDLGVKYFNGEGVNQDYSKAIEWWEKAADKNYADSQFNLGLMYYRGIGINKDFNKAQRLFEKAANQNHGSAQYSLGVMYAFGQGVSQSYNKALELFFKAAALNLAQAQFNLGVFYENGYGVEADATEANKWYQLAANQGLAEATKKVGNVKPASTQPKQAIVETKKEPTSTKPEVVETISKPIAAPVTNSVSSELPSQRERTDWLRSQPEKTYTIQIASFLSETETIDYINKNNLDMNAGYVNVFVKNEKRISLLYGYYSSYSQAKQAATNLSSLYTNIKPWVRNIGKLQETLR